MRDSVTASANFAGIAANPGASTSIICGMKISPAMVSMPSQKAITANASRGEAAGGPGPSAASRPGTRHEGGVERALAEQAAEQVGQFQGDEERIGHRPGAEHRGDQHVPGEAENAARHGPAADRQDAANHASISLCGLSAGRQGA